MCIRDSCTPNRITNMLKVLLQASLVLVVGAQKPVVRIARFAGQYAKPRSSNEETRDGVSLPSFRGDNINRPEFTLEARTPDPELLLRGYERASMTLNFIRALVKGGFADLHHPEYFDLDWVQHSPLADDYHRMATTITEGLRFMENVLGVRAGESDLIDFFTAHEALHLGYESAQTRRVPRRPGFFDLTTHFPWVGLRTNHPDDAHVEFLRGIENPIGIKVGHESGRDRVARWLDTLDPKREPGRLTLIHRFGVKRIADALPPLVEMCIRDRHSSTFIRPSVSNSEIEWRRHYHIACGRCNSFFMPCGSVWPGEPGELETPRVEPARLQIPQTLGQRIADSFDSPQRECFGRIDLQRDILSRCV